MACAGPDPERTAAAVPGVVLRAPPRGSSSGSVARNAARPAAGIWFGPDGCCPTGASTPPSGSGKVARSSALAAASSPAAPAPARAAPSAAAAPSGAPVAMPPGGGAGAFMLPAPIWVRARDRSMADWMSSASMRASTTVMLWRRRAAWPSGSAWRPPPRRPNGRRNLAGMGK